jgi:hypothetical protein
MSLCSYSRWLWRSYVIWSSWSMQAQKTGRTLMAEIWRLVVSGTVESRPHYDHNFRRRFRPLYGDWTEYMGAGQGASISIEIYLYILCQFQVCILSWYSLWSWFSLHSVGTSRTTSNSAHIGGRLRPARWLWCPRLPQNQARGRWPFGKLSHPRCAARQIC